MRRNLKWFYAAGIPAVLFCAPVQAKKPMAHPSPIIAMVRQVNGEVRSLGKDTAVSFEVKLSDMVPTGRTFTVGEAGLLVLRFHPDFARIEARALTRYRLSYARGDSTKPRRVRLEEGTLVLNVPKRSPMILAEDAHSRLKIKDARFSFSSDPKVASTIVVLDGTVEIKNNAKDVGATVRRGQKAVSDINGLRITDATDAELEQVGLKQNILELDFWNPENEEFSTLEMEYESNF